ncbi:MAG: GFA family protein [Pseudomonadota bacterium]
MSKKLHVRGSCHCGGVKFEADLVDGYETARRCDCSICRMRGAIAVSANVSEFTILKGGELLSLYQFNTKQAEHYFCSVCGIYTHHKRRSKPHEYGINVACIDDKSPFDFETVPVMDGQSHPKDGAKARVAGHLNFEATVETKK